MTRGLMTRRCLDSLLRLGGVLLLGLAVSFVVPGCDSRSTDIEGPDFVGFSYVPADFEGIWSGSFVVEPLDIFETVQVEIDDTGFVIGGRDSRDVDVALGRFFFLDTTTGEMQFHFTLDDGLRVDALALMEQGGAGMIGQFLTNLGAVGDFRLARTVGEGTFDVASVESPQRLRLVDAVSEVQRDGTLYFDSEGAITDESDVDGVQVTVGNIEFTDDERGDVLISINLDDEESLFLHGVFSLSDGRSAGTTLSFFPSSNGFFLLEPLSLFPDDEESGEDGDDGGGDADG